MSYADKVFIDMCNDIINNGFSSEGYKVRPLWEDGTPAHTIKKFGIVNRYDLQKEFPILTLRKTYLKSAVNEILWIWQKKSNNINDLNSSIWDEWADEKGRIGKAYGFQQSLFHPYRDVSMEGLEKAFPNLKEGKADVRFGDAITDTGFKFDYNKKRIFGYDLEDGVIKRPIAIKYHQFFYMTQIDKAIYDLINNPLSRRIIVTMWNPEDLHDMNLEPCAYSMTFNVTGNKLNGILNQRSQDVLAANNWNVVQYSVLIHMIAQITGLVPGELVHVIADAHIYDRHIPIIKELITREPLPAPKFELNPEISSFYDFSEDDIKLTGYETHPQILDIPIAI